MRGRDGEVGGAVENGPGEGEGGAGADREAVVERHRGIPGTRLLRVFSRKALLGSRFLKVSMSKLRSSTGHLALSDEVIKLEKLPSSSIVHECFVDIYVKVYTQRTVFYVNPELQIIMLTQIKYSPGASHLQ